MRGTVFGVNREKGKIAVRVGKPGGQPELTILEWCEGINQGDVLDWQSSGLGTQTYKNTTKGKPVSVVVLKHDAHDAELYE